jgi:hypothetical protein
MTICCADHGHGKVSFADQALILKPLPETVGEACLGFNGRLADEVCLVRGFLRGLIAWHASLIMANVKANCLRRLFSALGVYLRRFLSDLQQIYSS